MTAAEPSQAREIVRGSRVDSRGADAVAATWAIDSRGARAGPLLAGDPVARPRDGGRRRAALAAAADVVPTGDRPRRDGAGARRERRLPGAVGVARPRATRGRAERCARRSRERADRALRAVGPVAQPRRGGGQTRSICDPPTIASRPSGYRTHALCVPS